MRRGAALFVESTNASTTLVSWALDDIQSSCSASNLASGVAGVVCSIPGFHAAITIDLDLFVTAQRGNQTRFSDRHDQFQARDHWFSDGRWEAVELVELDDESDSLFR
jgi:hypothetical protein